MSPFSSASTPFPALGGQLCERALRDGSALVGILQLPADFVPVEGAAYLLIEHDDRIGLVPEALDRGLTDDYAASGVGELMTSPIWNRTNTPDARVVRFFEAFPDTNHWVVFGPSHHASPEGAPPHRWRAADANGRWRDIPPPIEACGLAIAQILTTHPIWPDAQGVLHTLSALPSAWRAHFHRYHQVLAQSARDPDLDARLESVLREDPIFRHIQCGRVDRQFCAFLAAMNDHGMLRPDAPRSAADHLKRETMRMASLRESLSPGSDRQKTRPRRGP